MTSDKFFLPLSIHSQDWDRKLGALGRIGTDKKKLTAANVKEEAVSGLKIVDAVWHGGTLRSEHSTVFNRPGSKKTRAQWVGNSLWECCVSGGGARGVAEPVEEPISTVQELSNRWVTGVEMLRRAKPPAYTEKLSWDVPAAVLWKSTSCASTGSSIDC